MKKSLALVVCIIFALSSLTGCASQPTQSSSGGETPAQKAEPIRIGALFPFSGSLAALGNENFRGMELAVKKINDSGGINGRPIEMVKADAPDPTAAVAEADRLISKEGLKAIVGTYSSSISFAATEVAERNGVIYLEVGGISDPITERGYKYLFRTVPNASSYGIYGIRFAKAMAPRLNKAPEDLVIVVIGEDSMYGTTCGDYAEKEAAVQGMKIAERIRYNAKTNDLSSVILKLKEIKPDAIIHTSYITDTILFFRQARELDFHCPMFIGQGGGYALRDFADSVGDNVNGIYNVDYPQVDINPATAKGIDEFLALYKEVYGGAPQSAHSLVSYQGTLVLMEALKNAGSDDPDKVREAMLAIDIPEGETSTGYGVKFAGPDAPNAGQNVRAFPLISQWQNNNQITVWPEEYAATKDIIFPQPAWH